MIAIENSDFISSNCAFVSEKNRENTRNIWEHSVIFIITMYILRSRNHPFCLCRYETALIDMIKYFERFQCALSLSIFVILTSAHSCCIVPATKGVKYAVAKSTIVRVSNKWNWANYESGLKSKSNHMCYHTHAPRIYD